MRFYRLASLGLALSLLASCSLAFTDGPPEKHHRLRYFDCSRSWVVPVLDTIYTALQVTSLGILVAEEGSENQGTALGVTAGFTALGAAGMYVGYDRVSRCKSATRALWERLSVEEARARGQREREREQQRPTPEN